jgi:hypothetical protein
MEIAHLGNDVWLLHGFFYTETSKDLIFQKKRMIAFTADSSQSSARQMLKEKGFKEYFTFRTAHAVMRPATSHFKKETLTLWMKISKDADDSSNEPIVNDKGWNCSVILEGQKNNYHQQSCIIRIKTEKDMDLKGFQQVGRSPIFVSFKNDSLIKNHRK